MEASPGEVSCQGKEIQPGTDDLLGSSSSVRTDPQMGGFLTKSVETLGSKAIPRGREVQPAPKYRVLSGPFPGAFQQPAVAYQGLQTPPMPFPQPPGWIPGPPRALPVVKDFQRPIQILQQPVPAFPQMLPQPTPGSFVGPPQAVRLQGLHAPVAEPSRGQGHQKGVSSTGPSGKGAYAKGAEMEIFPEEFADDVICMDLNRGLCSIAVQRI